MSRPRQPARKRKTGTTVLELTVIFWEKPSREPGARRAAGGNFIQRYSDTFEGGKGRRGAKSRAQLKRGGPMKRFLPKIQKNCGGRIHKVQRRDLIWIDGGGEVAQKYFLEHTIRE